MSHVSLTRVLSAAALAAVTGISLVGCAAFDDGGSEASGGSAISVVASTTQVADFTREVVGDTGVTVTQIVQPNQSAHDIELDASQVAAIDSADAVIVNGVDLDHVVSDAAPADKVIDTSTGVTLRTAAEDEHEHEEGEAEEEEHDHGEYDPHIWTDPANAEIQVRNIAEGLAAIDEANADTYEANADAYIGKIETLNTWITDTFAPVDPAQRVFVSTHDAFGYFIAAYDITQNDSVLASLDDNAEPSEAALTELIDSIKATGAKAVFAEASINASLAERIADGAGVELYSGDDALYGDSLGAAGSDGDTYLKATVHNVKLIAQSWGVSAEDPTGL